MNQNNQFNNYDPNTGQPLNNTNQPTQTLVTNQPDVNDQMQMNNNNMQNTQMNNNVQNTQVNGVSESATDYVYNQEVTKAYNTLKSDFILLVIIHFISTIFGVFVLEYSLFVLVLRFGILAMFICGFISAKNERSSAITFATISAILLILTMSFIEIGLGVFLLMHSGKCSKVIKGK